ncbi:hypothetical protein AABB24_015092 [Solanum stoloniferum]|uniref:Uncharacterized protein n=2 Tax=Solanum TaxID=4107 RepID=A0AAF0UEV6_SOLVR|nr:uncharacterized protein LOC125826578 [Solanum verrucosum]WMV44114.1 hypothetical protein MTR67_037499 [Solanum verrucosum]
MCKGFQPNEKDRLKIKGIYLHLSFSSPTETVSPDSLTLHYLPRISESPLEINESKIRSNFPGFVTLHRVVSAEKVTTKGVIYGSRDRVKASEGVKFEIFMADVKLIKGIFMKDLENWRIDCKCALENDDLKVKGAEVCVAVEGRTAAEVITEKVEMTVRKRRTRRRSCFQKLEEIPEQREVENDESTCCCSECEGEEDDSDGSDAAEGVGWAVDVGIWVMCLGVGVGYLVSRASSKSLRRRRFI